LAKKEKSKEDVYRFITQVAGKQGWGVAREPEFLDHIAEGLMTTHKRHGYFLCPCRDGSGERAEDEDIVCPCIYNIPDQKEYGHCFCGLFYNKTYQEDGGGFNQIPDRRPEELYD
jgi:ferredoxin-thioredoxin reductase catalytic chain